MFNTPYWMSEFEQLLLKIASKPSSLVWIDELKAFYQKFKGTEEYHRIRFDCENMISTIYHHAGFLEKSFEIDLILLKGNHPNASGYWAVISRAIGTSVKLERTREVVPYAFNFLNAPDDTISKKSTVLLWYAKIFVEEENSFFKIFEHIVQNIESFVEEKTDPKRPFLERIEYLHDKFYNALVASNLFDMAYSKANKEERSKLLKEYLASEPLKYYRERVKLYT